MADSAESHYGITLSPADLAAAYEVGLAAAEGRGASGAFEILKKSTFTHLDYFFRVNSLFKKMVLCLWD